MFVSKLLRFKTIISRKYSKIIRKEYTVVPNVNINLLLSYKTVIKPLDVVEYPNSDKLIVNCEKEINANQIGDSINLSTNREPYDNNVTCEIIAPIKSNFNVTAMGDINIANFLGEAVRLFSQHGNINIGKTQTDYIAARTNEGNIVTVGEINAAKVVLKSIKQGSINAKKIKCLGLNLETENGEINTESSYCEQSYFVTRNGRMNLQNVHKHSRVVVEKNGELKMTGFDGLLEVLVQDGKADIQISRITQNSDIHIKGEGQLKLRLGDEVIKNCTIEVFSPYCSVDDDIAYEGKEDEERTLITHENVPQDGQKLKIQAPRSKVIIERASWSDMVKESFEKSSLERKL